MLIKHMIVIVIGRAVERPCLGNSERRFTGSSLADDEGCVGGSANAFLVDISTPRPWSDNTGCFHSEDINSEGTHGTLSTQNRMRQGPPSQMPSYHAADVTSCSEGQHRKCAWRPAYYSVGLSMYILLVRQVRHADICAAQATFQSDPSKTACSFTASFTYSRVPDTPKLLDRSDNSFRACSTARCRRALAHQTAKLFFKSKNSSAGTPTAVAMAAGSALCTCGQQIYMHRFQAGR